MELAQLRALREVRDRGSIAAVAAAMRVTPSSISQQLSALQRSAGVRLTRIEGRASAMPAGERLEAFAETRSTLAIHLSVHALPDIAARLIPFYGADCPAAVVFRASWPDERIIRASLATLAEAVQDLAIERTAVIFVGEVLAAAGFRESALYSADYRRRFRGRAAE